MTFQDTDRVLARLLADCRVAMTDPCPAMEQWGPYCRLVAFKLANVLTDEQRLVVDAVLMHLRGRLAALARSQFDHWQPGRQGKAPTPRRSAAEPLARQPAVAVDRGGEGAYVYHGTVRGLLPPVHLRGLRPEFSPDWRRGGTRCRVVTSWREAEVDAVLAHLHGPLRRVSSYWLPAILRLPIDPTAPGIAIGRSGPAIDDPESLSVAAADVWLIGEEPRPHWQPLMAVLSRRRPSPLRPIGGAASGTTGRGGHSSKAPAPPHLARAERLPTPPAPTAAAGSTTASERTKGPVARPRDP